MVRTLASHQCGPGLNIRLSVMLVKFVGSQIGAKRFFSSPQKPIFDLI